MKWPRVVQWCAFVNTVQNIGGHHDCDYVGKVMTTECEISDKGSSEFVVGRVSLGVRNYGAASNNRYRY
jgi:hypothetical protein